MSRFFMLLASLVMALLQGAMPAVPIASAQTEPQQWSAPPDMTIDPNRAYSAIISTNFGNIEIALFADEAPLTVNNFVFLANAGFYDGVPFHRIIKDFMIQTG